MFLGGRCVSSEHSKRAQENVLSVRFRTFVTHWKQRRASIIDSGFPILGFKAKNLRKDNSTLML